MAISDKSLWWYLLIFACILAWVLVLGGCDDIPAPEVRYLAPPVVRSIGYPGFNRNRLDAWELDEEEYPIFAAFGWYMTFCWANTDEVFEGPGIHTVFAAGENTLGHWVCPILRKSVTGTGNDAEGDPDSITAISGDNGVTKFYLLLHDWPDRWFLNQVYVQGRVCGRDWAWASDCKFEQEPQPFFAPYGGLSLSVQGAPYYNYGTEPMMMLLTSSGPDTSSDPNIPMDLGPTSPTPKVLVADIPPALAECANFEGYPPYSDPNTNGEGILIRSRWMKTGVVNGEWVLSPAPFITLLPYDSNDIASIAETAWPYIISYHAPSESAGLGVIEAKLSIVDPNGGPTSAIDIQAHEVGQCPNCDGWLWRSDYILPLTSRPFPLMSRAGDVIVAWLPPGHSFKIEPTVNGAVLKLAANWLAQGGPLDLNGDGTVDFRDYSILLGMR